jgi:hypothetical protein
MTTASVGMPPPSIFVLSTLPAHRVGCSMEGRTMGKTKQKTTDRWEMKRRLRDSGGLLIGVGIQRDGAVYSLDSSAKKRLAEVPPSTPRPKNVFIGHESASDFERIHSALWPKIVEMLAGMTLEQLRPFAPVRIYSPDLERVVWEWQPDNISRPQ